MRPDTGSKIIAFIFLLLVCLSIYAAVYFCTAVYVEWRHGETLQQAYERMIDRDR